MINKKNVTLCFRGFDLDPQVVEVFIGHKASDFGTKGRPVKPGVKTLLKRSFVRYSRDFDGKENLDDIVEVFFSDLGGLNNLVKVRDRISAEFVDLSFVLQIKSSDEQESAFLTTKTLESLVRLRAILSFQFI